MTPPSQQNQSRPGTIVMSPDRFTAAVRAAGKAESVEEGNCLLNVACGGRPIRVSGPLLWTDDPSVKFLPAATYDGHVFASSSGIIEAFPGSVIHGSLWLAGTAIPAVPDNMAVHGDFICSGCPSLRSISSARIHGDLWADNCPILTQIAESLSVSGRATYQGSPIARQDRIPIITRIRDLLLHWLRA